MVSRGGDLESTDVVVADGGAWVHAPPMSLVRLEMKPLHCSQSASKMMAMSVE